MSQQAENIHHESIEEAQYLEERLANQENWYDRKSQWNQRWYKRLAMLQIIAAAVIPFLAGNVEKLEWAPWLIGVLGVFVAVSSASNSLFKFQENWIQYRATCEALRHQRYLYLTGSPPYNVDDPFHLLVKNVEGLVSQENAQWTHFMNNEPAKEQPVAPPPAAPTQ